MANDRIVYRDYSTLESISPSHNIGQKKVLLSNVETISNITQLAITKLAAGDIVEEHVHPTMDEHYIIVSGEGSMQIDKEDYELKRGKFILVPAGSYHSLSVTKNIEFIIISISL